VFARKNDDPITLRFLLGLSWEAPLILVLLASFVLGAALGVLACLSRWFQQRREILRLKRELRAKDAEPETKA
jgi:lipopolysaccharide assembly protein A